MDSFESTNNELHGTLIPEKDPNNAFYKNLKTQDVTQNQATECECPNNDFTSDDKLFISVFVLTPITVAPIVSSISAIFEKNHNEFISLVIDAISLCGTISTSIASLNYDYSEINTQEHMFAVVWISSVVPYAYLVCKQSMQNRL